MNKQWKLSVLALLTVTIFSLAIANAFAEITTLAVTPSTAEFPSIQVGQSITVNITVNSVANLSAWSAGITWNASVLNLTDVKEGPFLKTAGTTVFLWTRSDPTITNGSTQIDDAVFGYDTANGTGTLAVLTFKVLKSGVSTIGLNSTRMVQPPLTYLPISYTPANATITILDAPPVNSTSPSNTIPMNSTNPSNTDNPSNSTSSDTNSTDTQPSSSTPTNSTSPSNKPPTDSGSSDGAGMPIEMYLVVGAGVVFAALLSFALILQRRTKNRIQ